MGTTHQNRFMKCGTSVWRACSAAIALMLSAGADEAPGQGVCWDMKQGEPTIRALVGNRVVDRPQSQLDFIAVKGGGLAQLAPVLRDTETSRLEDMLAAASPRKRFAIAHELASRCLGNGDKEKARAFFQAAADDSASFSCLAIDSRASVCKTTHPS